MHIPAVPLSFLRPFFSLCAVALLFHLPAASAQDVYMDDIRTERAFVKALVTLPEPMIDLAEMQLKLMEKAFPKDGDAIKVSYATFYEAQGQRTKAREALAGITKTSKYYADAALKRTTLTADDAEREKAYRDYFSVVKEPPKDPRDIEDFVELVFKYYMTLVRQGNYKKADSILELTKQLPKENQINPNMLIFMKSKTILDSAEEQFDKTKSLGKLSGPVNKAAKDLNQLIWNMDFVTAMAYGEIAHAHILQGDPDKALEVLNQATVFLRNAEKGALAQDVPKAASPLAPALFYAGDAFMAKARPHRGKNDAKMIEFLKMAYPKFYQVAKDYKGSPIESKAVARLALLGRIFESKGIEPPIQGNQEQELKYEAGLTMLRGQEYAKAGQMFLESAALNLRGSKVPEALKFAVVCLYKEERYLEAMAIADFLYEWYPRSEETQTALYNLAVTMIKAKQDEGDSNLLLGRFGRIAPEHPKAPWCLYRCAEYQYKQGSAAKKEKQAAEDAGKPVKDVNALIEKMRATYLESVPLYEILTRHYGTSEYGAKSYYKLAWVYHIVGDNEKAATNFLSYCDAVEQPTKEKAQAKFYAAERLMRAQVTKEAIRHFEELIAWTGPKGEFAKIEGVKKYRVDALGLLPWCYDSRYRILNAESEKLQEELANWGKPKEEAAPAEDGEKPKEEDKAEQPKQETAEKPEGGADEEQALSPEEQKVQIDAREKKLRVEAMEFRKKAMAGFITYVDRFPEGAQHADNMYKLGSLYLEDKDFSNAAKTLGNLIAKYPESSAAKLASFHLGRAHAENGDWVKASEVLKGSVATFPTMSTANLGFIAGALENGLDAEIVLRANHEVAKRANDKSHEDYAKLVPLRERALFRASECYLRLEQYQEAIDLSDRVLQETEAKKIAAKKAGKQGKESPYYFDILFNKGTAFFAQGKYAEALKSFEYVLTYLRADRQPGKYYRGLVECGRTLMAMDNAKVGAARYMQVVDFADPKNEEVQPWLELAYLEGARALHKAGNTDRAKTVQDDYARAFPDGKYKSEILNLDGGSAPAPKKAAPAPEEGSPSE